MSGGFFEYKDSSLARDIFGWDIDFDYNLADKDIEKNRAKVRKRNVFEDKEISEMIYDIFCIIHSYDWYTCGDTGPEDYRGDVKYFKDKWFGNTDSERIKLEIDKCTAEIRAELLNEFGLKEETE